MHICADSYKFTTMIPAFLLIVSAIVYRIVTGLFGHSDSIGLLNFAPLAALLLSDAVLGFYRGMGFVYGSMMLVVVIGWWLSSRRTPLRIGGAAVASSVLFYVLTNFGMWLFSGFYPLTTAGLAACYVAAIPFFQNTVAGDLFYATLLFGGFRIAELLVPSLKAGQAQPA